MKFDLIIGYTSHKGILQSFFAIAYWDFGIKNHCFWFFGTGWIIFIY